MVILLEDARKFLSRGALVVVLVGIKTLLHYQRIGRVMIEEAIEEEEEEQQVEEEEEEEEQQVEVEEQQVGEEEQQVEEQ